MNRIHPVVLVTGALSGIGRATALAFARHGTRLVVSGRRDADGAVLVAELKAAGGEAVFVRADVRFEADAAGLVAAAKAQYGRLDVAVNNAGAEGRSGPLAEATVEAYVDTFDTNVKGVLLALKHQLPAMAAQGGGSIVNLSSVAGHRGMPGAGIYVASKHAVEGLTRTAALEGAAFGVRVNAVAPGPVQTDMLDRFTGRNEQAKAGFVSTVPLKRTGTVDEIAAAILYLASPAAAYLTGQVLTVDGGLTSS